MRLTQWQQQQWPEVQRELGSIIDQLRPMNPLKVVLFGSYARGDFHEDSDVDLFIVCDTEQRVFDRVERALELVNTRMAIEPLVYTPAEVEQMRARRSSFLAEIESTGRVLYERASGA